MKTENFKHKIRIKVRFSDLDALRHVNNAVYLTYIEEARIDYFSSVLKISDNNMDFGAIVARIEIDYIHPIIIGDEIEVLSRVAKIGVKSSNVEHIILIKRGDKEILAAKAATVLVSYDYKKLTTVPIKEEVKNKIKDFEGI